MIIIKKRRKNLMEKALVIKKKKFPNIHHKKNTWQKQESWSYPVQLPRKVEQYVEQFYGYSNLLFQRKVYYRKLRRKVKQIWWGSSFEELSLWVVPHGTYLFRSYGRNGSFRWGERMWESSLFMGVKQWLLEQKGQISFILSTKGIRSRFWGGILQRLSQEHRAQVWTPPPR